MTTQFHLGKITNGAGEEIADEAYLTFGSAHGQDDGDCEIEITGGRAHEAARLITAAPNLLEALKRLVTDDEAYRDRGRPEYQEALEAARTAIAKAEGRS